MMRNVLNFVLGIGCSLGFTDAGFAQRGGGGGHGGGHSMHSGGHSMHSGGHSMHSGGHSMHSGGHSMHSGGHSMHSGSHSSMHNSSKSLHHMGAGHGMGSGRTSSLGHSSGRYASSNHVRSSGRSATITSRLRTSVAVTGRSPARTNRLTTNVALTRRTWAVTKRPAVNVVVTPLILSGRITRNGIVDSGVETAELQREDGLQILELADNGPAALGRLLVNDIITQVGGVRVQTTDELINALASIDGKTLIVFLNGENGALESTEVIVQDNRIGVTVQQVELPAPTGVNLASSNVVDAGAETPEAQTEYGLKILELTANGPAAEGRLMVNDIIVQVAGVRVQTTDELINKLANCAGRTTIVFLNSENGQLESTEVIVQDGRVGVTVQQVDIP